MDNILVISDFPAAQYRRDSGTPALRLILEAMATKYHLIVIAPEGERDGYPMAKEVHTIPSVGSTTVGRKAYPFLFYDRASNKAAEIVGGQGISLIYGAGALSTHVAGAVGNLSHPKTPSIGRLFGTYLYPHLNNPIRLLIKFEECKAFNAKCTKYIITDDGTRGDLTAEHFRIPKEDMYFWRNGVEAPPALPPRTDGKVRFISLARLEKWKRVDRIITAFLKVAEDYKHVNLDIVGDGPDRENLQRLAFKSHHLSKQVHFFGEVTRQKALHMLASSDVFVSTNDYSNVSNSLMEAMASGKCVIALDTGMTMQAVGTAGLIANSECGIEVAMRDALNVRTREELGERAKRVPYYSWNERIEKELKVIGDLI